MKGEGMQPHNERKRQRWVGCILVIKIIVQNAEQKIKTENYINLKIMKEILLSLADLIDNVAYNLACTHVGGAEAYASQKAEIDKIKTMISDIQNNGASPMQPNQGDNAG